MAQGGDIILVLLHIDELILIGSNDTLVTEAHSKLSKEF